MYVSRSPLVTCRRVAMCAVLAALGPAATAHSADHPSLDVPAVQRDVEAIQIQITAMVVRGDGSPVEGAVVVSSLGGKGVSDRDGTVRFGVDVDPSLDAAHVTAVAVIDGVNYVGTVQVGLDHAGESSRDVEAGVIVISADNECEPAWVPTFGGGPDMSSFVYSMTVFDDGSGNGPALYAGGSFTVAGGISASYIAKWDGVTWSPLGEGIDGQGRSVRALTVFDDGKGGGPALYAGGQFTSAGGESANNIAKWDGSSWSPLGSGMNHVVWDMTVFDDGSGSGPVLYAGGIFWTAGGVEANRIAKWDGSTWSPVGSGMDWPVSALAVFDDGSGDGLALYAGGQFTTAGGATANHVAKWDGSSWSPLGAGTNGSVGTLAVFDDGSGSGPALYAGGTFTTAGGATANHIAKWDGSSWSPLGSGVNFTVSSLAVYDDGSGGGPGLYVGGQLTMAGDTPANRIAKWDGSSWSALETGVTSSPGHSSGVYALAVFDDGSGSGPALYVGGLFQFAGSVSAYCIANWDGSSWSALGKGMNASVSTLTVFDDGSGSGPELYAAGSFTAVGGENANRIAKWDGAAWSPLGTGMNAVVGTLAVFDDGSGGGPALYAGGNFTTAGGVDANRIAKWDGSSWLPLAAGMNDWVSTLAVFDDGLGIGPALYAGGNFTTAGDAQANHIARWDGSSWSPLGAGVNERVSALTVFDDGKGAGLALYAGGRFTTAGDVQANHIAKWNGSSWLPVGTGMDGENPWVLALSVFDDGLGGGAALYAGGIFTIAGDVQANHIARWDGSSWMTLGAGMNEPVTTLTVFNDGWGAGPALYAGGVFTTAGGVSANRIAKWDGSSWSPVGTGVNLSVHALGVFDDGSGGGPALYVGGNFTVSPAGDSYLAKWQGCPTEPECAVADLNCDGVVDVSDLLMLLAAWGLCPTGGTPVPPCPADLNGDGAVDVSDLLLLLANWG